MFERFTERTRRAVVRAQNEAARLDHDYLGTEHLLLGLVAGSEGMAARILSNLDVGTHRARREVLRRLGVGR